MFKRLFKKSASQPSPPEWLQSYFEEEAAQPSIKTNLKQLRFVVIDTETTGLKIKKDHLLSIGAVVIEKEAIVVAQSIESVLFQEESMENEAILIHGLLPSDASLGKKVQSALAEFLTVLRHSVIVAHHVGFDVKMLENTFRLFYPKFRFYNHKLDTALLAMKVDRVHPQRDVYNREAYSLDRLCERYNIEVVERHTAWGDAYTTALLFMKLTQILEERGLHRLDQLNIRRMAW
ncbi:MAG: 3'-5' exonuclease [Bacteroidota bacterium]